MSPEPDVSDPRPPRRAPARKRRLPFRPVILSGLGLAAGLLLGWLLFHGDGDSSSTRPATTTTTTTTARLVGVGFSQFGLRLGRPAGWTTTIKRGVLNVASPDQTMSVAISMAQGRPNAQLVRRADRRQLQRLFHARLINQQRSSVGGQSTVLTELVGRTSKRRTVRILSTAVSSRWRTYSIQVFTVLRPRADRLIELRGLLASFRFSKPR